MCGIIATIGKNIPEAALASLHKRGPDDHGTLAFPKATLGHTRLAIIDLSPTGHQPMEDKERQIAISFNGEIYNYRELHAELEKKGYRFTTQSDTEVVLKCYAEYGVECPTHLDGMFAFALWDNKRERMFLARDRFGKKPLYHATSPDGTFAAASEIKALTAMGFKGEIDPAGLDSYLALMYMPPWRTVYKNISTLLPGHYAVYERGKLITTQYWQLPINQIKISYTEAKEEVRRLFDEAVRKRMIADVEIGSLLSGGVDSTIVTAYAQKYASHPLKTFSLGYGEYIDELPFAEQAAKTIGTEHYTLQANTDLVGELEKVLAYFDEPHGDPADFPQHLVSELASSKVKVALSGDGGDEVFLGYGLYWGYWNSSKLARLRNTLLSNPYQEHVRHHTVFNLAERRVLWHEAPLPEAIDNLVPQMAENDIQKMNLFDFYTYLPGQILTKVDRTSMMHSLEIRSPFLDHHLAEFVFNLPEEYKTNRKSGKLILKDLLAEVMPREFVDRKKQGFGAPVRKWLGEPRMRAYVEEKLGSGARVYSFLHERAVRDFIASTYASSHPKPYYQLWTLLCLELWLRQHNL
jgi:asparagine synthase (glutamine-hydrolysing)